jgi:nucleoside-diphosphate-sugar epimerase
MVERILVTGGAGYVGSVLVSSLLRCGYQVRVLDDFRMGFVGLTYVISDDNLDVVKGDVRDSQAVKKSLKGVDWIIHLAGIVGYPACRKDPELSRSINVGGAQTIVDAADGIPILFASTGSTYGKLIGKYCTETTPLNPISDYGKQKAEAEKIVSENAEFVNYRFATAFGVSPRMRMDLLPNDFAFRAVREKTLIVYEKDFMRTFIHVRDMARAFIFALENYSRIKGETFNVGDESMNYSKEAIAKMLQEKVDFYLHFADTGRDIDQRDYVVSYEKIKSVGFHCEVSMSKGLNELVKFFSFVDIPNPFSNA